MSLRLFIFAIALFSGATAGHAHHANAGKPPASVLEGLISGFGHPLIGLDHAAFLMGAGIAAAFMPSAMTTILSFVAATVAGCLLHTTGITLPMAEVVVAASVVLIGALVLSGRRIAGAAYGALFVIAGVFHGFAYGESIVGAEEPTFAAYLIGFAVIQMLVALTVTAIVRGIWNAATPDTVSTRLAGALVAGIGTAFLVEQIEGLLLGPMV
ncbi:MAG: HupE/UreJ family protein [Hyphomicrobiaceae bacterium]